MILCDRFNPYNIIWFRVKTNSHWDSYSVFVSLYLKNKIISLCPVANMTCTFRTKEKIKKRRHQPNEFQTNFCLTQISNVKT